MAIEVDGQLAYQEARHVQKRRDVKLLECPMSYRTSHELLRTLHQLEVRAVLGAATSLLGGRLAALRPAVALGILQVCAGNGISVGARTHGGHPGGKTKASIRKNALNA